MLLSVRVTKQKASMLIIALWALGLLTVLATTLGVGVRQKITLLSRIENRGKLSLLASSGIKKAIILLKQNAYGNITGKARAILFNNDREFREIGVGEGFYDVSTSDPALNKNRYYGLVDEERKININYVDQPVLKNLIKVVLGFDEMGASELARALVDWREYGESEIAGFYSDDFYDNLEYPYPPKNDSYELIDELLLVKGMNERIFRILTHYLTVYGDGKININTASRSVFVALGLNRTLVDKIMSLRRGPDGLEYTLDDFIFQQTDDLYFSLNQRFRLKDEDIQQIRWVLDNNLIDVVSSNYTIQSRAWLSDREKDHAIVCVFDVDSKKIVYWKEGS